MEKKIRKRIRKQEKVFTFKNFNNDAIELNDPVLKQIADFANENKTDIYVVGGYVRDYFLERPRTDIDITVVGDSIDFANKIAKLFNTKAVIFERFRTAMVPAGKYQIEFVGTRKEEYEENSRNPIVTEGTLEDDLKRRDFTVNAMAASLIDKTPGKIIDLFEGREDLKKRLLRTPLDPETTYNDDPLRMMRLARFAAQLRFKADHQSIKAIANMADRISIISQERITDELLKILASPKPSIGLNILYNTGLLKHIFPKLNDLAGIEVVEKDGRVYAHKDILKHSFHVLDNIAKNTDNLWLRFAALIHDIAKPATKLFKDDQGWTFHGHEELGARWIKKIFKQLKMPLDNIEYVEKLVRLHQRPMALVDSEVTDSAVRRLAVQADDALEDLFTMVRADITTKNPNLSEKYKDNYERVFQKVIDVQEKDKLRAFQSPVRGDEIMKVCKLEPSPAVGLIKSAIEEAILEGIIPNEYEPAKKFFKANYKSWLKTIKKGEEINIIDYSDSGR